MKLYLNLTFLFSLFFICSLTAEIERRAAIDVGSGGTKLMIADIETQTNQIIDILLDQSFPVPYQASLDKSEDYTFDEEVKTVGLNTFKEIKKIAENYQVQRITAVATSAFRKSNNAREFTKKIEKETTIKVRTILQQEEGEIAFFSALATGSFDSPQDVIVWDIGTGSLQMTTMKNDKELAVYMGETMGSVEFKSYIIDMIQEKDLQHVNSPNPIKEDELKSADKYARAFGRKAFPLIKEKIKNKAIIIGIGRLFYNSIRPLASEDGVITRKGLRAYINNALDKTDEELNNPFAAVDVSNCILALAIMKALHIQEILPVESTTTRGMLVNPSYWDN